MQGCDWGHGRHTKGADLARRVYMTMFFGCSSPLLFLFLPFLMVPSFQQTSIKSRESVPPESVPPVSLPIRVIVRAIRQPPLGAVLFFQPSIPTSPPVISGVSPPRGCLYVQLHSAAAHTRQPLADSVEGEGGFR